MESKKTNSLIPSDWELNKYRNYIEELVEARTKELKKAKEIAELASKVKSEFFINMKHDLRSPLNAILGFTQIMSRSKDFPVEHKKNLEMITQSSEHLLNLIDQVIALVKIDINETNIDKINFKTLLEELQNTYHLKSSKKPKEDSSFQDLVETENLGKSIKTLPDELLMRFLKAIKMGDIELIEEINTEITNINSYTGNYFNKLIEDYEFEHLAKLIKDNNNAEIFL